MDTAMMIGLSRQMTLRRSLDITANNIANMNTTGFKAEQLMLESTQPGKATATDTGNDISYVHDWGVGRDFRDGALTRSGRDLDIALDGEGFFTLQGASGPVYTRDGRFVTDATGRLTAADGTPVLDESGSEIILDGAGGPPKIDSAGAITMDGAEIARLGIARFESLSELEKQGDSRFRAPEGVFAEAVEIPSVRQGFIESSNVNSVLELTKLMQITRAYTSVSKMIQDASELHRESIRRLGQVNA